MSWRRSEAVAGVYRIEVADFDKVDFHEGSGDATVVVHDATGAAHLARIPPYGLGWIIGELMLSGAEAADVELTERHVLN